MDAINGLSLEQQWAVQAASQHPSDDLGASYLPRGPLLGYMMNDLGHAHHVPPVTTPRAAVHASTPQGDASFHFGWSNAIHSIRVSTFSELDHDYFYEQVRYDVYCLINQGTPEGMALTAIKRSIKGQAQETVLYMGESASVKAFSASLK